MVKIRQFIIGVCILIFTNIIYAYEYGNGDELPSFIELKTNLKYIGIKSKKNRFLGNQELFFLFDDKIEQFIEVTKEKYDENLPTLHFLSISTDAKDMGGRCVYNEQSNKLINIEPHRISIGEKSVATTIPGCDLLTGLRIIDDTVWVGTYRTGSHTNVEAGGLYVLDIKSGKTIKQIRDVGIVNNIFYVNSTKQVWSLGEGAVYKISSRYKITPYYFKHIFNSQGIGTIVSSSEKQENQPLAVIARSIPAQDKHKYFEAVNKIPVEKRDKFSLYYFFLCCDPGLPKLDDDFKVLAPFFVRAAESLPMHKRRKWWQQLCRINGYESYCKKL